MPFLSHILRHRTVDLAHFVPVYVDHEQIGWTKRDFAKLMGHFNFAWIYADDRLTLNPTLDSFEKRTQTVHDVFMEISAQGFFPIKPDYSLLGGDDWLPVGQDRWSNPLFAVARYYAACIGIRRESVMLHAYEDDKMWLAVRGQGVDDSVGSYDMVAAGCMTMGQSIHEALMDEGSSECGLTDEAATHVKRGAQLHVMYHNASGFIIDEIYHVFDLDAKNLFKPRVVRHLEVDHFDLVPMNEVIHMVEKTNRVRPQICYILIDFFLRHGYLKSDTPDYHQILEELSTPYAIAA